MRVTGLVVALGLAATPAFADGQFAPPTVEYIAPSSCPDARAFRRSLDARLAASPGTSLRTIRSIAVRIEERTDTFVGTVRLVDVDQAESARTVSGKTCEELADAFAFLAALAMIITPRPPPEPPAESSTPPTMPAATRQDRVVSPRPSPESPTRWRFAVGADAIITSSLVPGVVLGPEAFLQASYVSEGIVAPTARLSGARLTSDASSPSGPTALTLTTGRLEGCPVRWRPARTFGLFPCGAVDAGLLEGVANAVDRQGAWVSLGLLGHLEWDPLPWLLLGAEGGILVPVVRTEFYVAPGPVLYTPPVLGGLGGAGAGVLFP